MRLVKEMAFPAFAVQLRGKVCGSAEWFAEGFQAVKQSRSRSAGCRLDLQRPPVFHAKHPRRPATVLRLSEGNSYQHPSEPLSDASARRGPPLASPPVFESSC